LDSRDDEEDAQSAKFLRPPEELKQSEGNKGPRSSYNDHYGFYQNQD